MFSAQARAVVRFVITDGMLTVLDDEKLVKLTELMRYESVNNQRIEDDDCWVIFALENSELCTLLHWIQERYHAEES